MFDIGFQEIVVIGLIALLVFGPTKLPELGRMFGRALREFRRASDEFRSTVETNLHINDTESVIAATPSTPSAATPTTLPSELEPPSPETSDVTPPSPGGEVGPEITEPFCAQRASRLFHRRECTWVRRIPEIDRVYLKRVADARDQGFTECPVCEPWEPA